MGGFASNRGCAILPEECSGHGTHTEDHEVVNTRSSARAGRECFAATSRDHGLSRHAIRFAGPENPLSPDSSRDGIVKKGTRPGANLGSTPSEATNSTIPTPLPPPPQAPTAINLRPS